MTEQKKALKVLLIALAIVIVLLIAVVAVISLNPQQPEQVSSEETGSISLISFDSDQLASATVHMQNDDYTITMANGTASIEQLGDIPLNQTTLDQFILDIATVTADIKVTENPDDWALYGLDKPQYVEVCLNDQTKYRINAGDEAPLGGTYVSLEGDNSVYIIGNGVSNIIKNKTDYISLDLIENPNKMDEEGNITVVNPDSMTLSGAVRNGEAITIIESQEYNMTPTKYILPDYYGLPTDNVFMSDMVAKLAPFSADSAVAVLPQEQVLAQYGLEVPRSILTFIIGGETHTISLGNKQDDMYYVMVDDINCIYAINSEYVPWAEATVYDLLASPLFDPDVTEINSMELEYGNITHIFDVESELYGSDYALSKVQLDGKDYNADSFKEIYSAFTVCTAVQKKQSDISQQGSLSLAVTVHYGENDVVSKFEFYKLNDNAYLMQLNGEISLTVAGEDVDNLLQILGGI